LFESQQVLDWRDCFLDERGDPDSNAACDHFVGPIDFILHQAQGGPASEFDFHSARFCGEFTDGEKSMM